MTLARLERLREAADGLSSKLSERASKKGGQVGATTLLHDAVSRQKDAWGRAIGSSR